MTFYRHAACFLALLLHSAGALHCNRIVDCRLGGNGFNEFLCWLVDEATGSCSSTWVAESDIFHLDNGFEAWDDFDAAGDTYG